MNKSKQRLVTLFHNFNNLKKCVVLIQFQVENNQFINLTAGMIVAGCGRHTDNNTGINYIRCKGTRNFNTARERWWFIAVSNCNSSRGLKLRYRVVFHRFSFTITPNIYKTENLSELFVYYCLTLLTCLAITNRLSLTYFGLFMQILVRIFDWLRCLFKALIPIFFQLQFLDEQRRGE